MVISLFISVIQIVARDGAYVTIRLRSAKCAVPSDCRATIGEVLTLRYAFRVKLEVAGGIRPTVRGSTAMNSSRSPTVVVMQLW